MKKSLLALAVLGAFAGAASAQSSVTMYGRVDLSVGKFSGEDAKGMFNGSGSRLGMRGVEDLGGGLKALFNIEHRFDADTGGSQNFAGTTSLAGTPVSAASTRITNRFWGARSIVGLEGAFGQVVLGREYTTAFLQSQLAADPWGWDTVASGTGAATALCRTGSLATGTYSAAASCAPTQTTVVSLAPGGTSGITGLGGIAKVRNDSALTYKISFSGVTIGAQVAERTDAINNFPKRPMNFAVSYGGGPLAFGLGYEITGRSGRSEASTVGGGRSVNEKAITVNGSYAFGPFKLGGFYGTGNSFDTGEKHKSYMLTGVLGLGAGELRLAAGELKIAGDKANRMIAAGYHHSLSKRTTVYADVVNNSNQLRKDAGLANPGKTGYDVGLKHNF
jgi:predicted porin